jgi:Uma2 family endonuclease
LPTMYDLPSEDPEETGLPDEFHDLQPQFLSATLRLTDYERDQIFTGTDLNLYYNVRHPLWHKRPDWFLVVGVPRLYDGVDLRSSYVIWQEGVSPFVVVELLSPGTANEDLGPYGSQGIDEGLPSNASDANPLAIANSNFESPQEKPPSKWQVYEQVLRVPYYAVFSRYTNRLRGFKLVGGHYQEQTLDANFWIPELQVGLALWEGAVDGVPRQWLRWQDATGNWIPTEADEERQRANQERQRANQEQQRADRLAERLRQAGIDPDV